MHTPSVQKRKRVNFMIDLTLLRELEEWIPTGERSDFVNAAMEEALTDWGRRKAIELLEESIKKDRRLHSTKEILKIIHDSRRY